MRNILAIIAGLGLLVATFAGLALAIVVGVAAAGTIAVARMFGRFQPSVTKNPTGERQHGAKPDYRVWNDGRGTIIDM